MVSKIGLIIAAIVFFIFFYFMLSYIISQTRSYGFIAESSALRSYVQTIWITLFTSSGIPENWETTNLTILPGLKTNLYKIPLVVNETSGTDRGLVTLNVSLKLDDETCSKKINSSSLRIYEGELEINSSLYNKTFCSNGYLNFTKLVFRANFSAYQSKTFTIFYSSESVQPPIYYVDYPTSPATNFSYYFFSEEVVPMISLSKLNAFENLSYEEVKTSLGIPEGINLEIVIGSTDTLLANRTFNYGLIPRGNIFTFSGSIVMQDIDGKIKYVLPIVRLWK